VPPTDIQQSSLYNEDLAPVPPERRTWGTYNYASLWVGMSVCIPTYMLASGLIAGCMNWWQAIGTILLGNLIVLIPMLLNAHKGEPILAARGVHPEIRRAILSHASFTGVPRESLLEKTLFACDELAGFLTACAYVKPGRSIAEVDAKSVRKKLKDKAFARSVNRDDIVNGAQELRVDLDQHITFCIEAMKSRAEELGLAGTKGSEAAAPG